MNAIRFSLAAVVLVAGIALPLSAQDVCDLSGPPTGSYYTPDGYKVSPGAQVTFTIHFTVATDDVIGVTNGYRVYVSDQSDGSTILNPGPARDSLSCITIVDMSRYLDGAFSLGSFSNDGIGADTVKFGGFALFKTGIPVGFDEDVYTISTKVDVSPDGQAYYLCLDSSFAPPGAIWLWALPAAGQAFPYWGGPYCYEIKTCCFGTEGNIDGDDLVGIGDLSALVAYVFPPHTPLPCSGAGNVDGITVGGSPINVSDVTYLIAYLFQGGPAPVVCDQ